MFDLIERMINQNNFVSIEDMRHKIDVFYLVNPPRLNEEEYRKLNEMLNAKEKELAGKEEVK